MKAKSQNLKFGNFALELGLIKSVKVEGDKVILTALPRHLEGYGLSSDGHVDVDKEFTIASRDETIHHCLSCYEDLLRAKGYVKEASIELEKWISKYKASNHTKTSKKIRNLKEGDLTKHGLVVRQKDSPIFSWDRVCFIGQTYGYFSKSTMVSVGDFEEGTGFDEEIKVHNGDINYCTLFAANSRDDINESNVMLDNSILFVKEVYADIMKVDVNTVDLSVIKYEE